MIYKYYRYILVLKLLCLISGIYYFVHDWYAPYDQGGTVIVSYVQSGIVLDGIKPLLDGTPLPWALVAQQTSGMTVHIPWTNDVAYVFNYLGAPLPTLKHTTNVSPYTQACKKRIIINAERTYEETCYYTPYKNLIILIVLLFIMLL